MFTLPYLSKEDEERLTTSFKLFEFDLRNNRLSNDSILDFVWKSLVSLADLYIDKNSEVEEQLREDLEYTKKELAERDKTIQSLLDQLKGYKDGVEAISKLLEKLDDD